MDSTEEVAPVGVLMALLRDKQALAIPAGKPAYLERTPADLPLPQLIHFQVEGTLSDKGVFTGHFAQSTTGDVEMLYRAVFRMVPQSKWKEALQGVSGALGFSGEVSNPQVSDVEQISQPFSISYDYTREKYGQWDDHFPSHWISPPLPAMGAELAPGVKEKKPADEPELGALGETTYHAAIELPKGWTMTVPHNVDLQEDWLEYHAKYSFKDGIFTADRTGHVKKSKLPLEDWEKYQTIRRAMYEDWNRQTLISPPGEEFSQLMPSRMITGLTPAMREQMDKMDAAMQPIEDAVAILAADPPANADDLAKAVDLANKGLDATEAETLTLPESDPQSYEWIGMLNHAWIVRGWAALEVKDLVTAESYLRAAWKLSHDQMSGYQLGRLLEAKGDKTTAAHQYELAQVSGKNYLDNAFYHGYNAQDRIADSYQKLTGKSMTATPLNHGQYNGSLLAELDKETTIHGFIPTSKYTGDAYFAVAYETGKPAKATLLDGDKKFAPLGATLEARKLGGLLPTGSKARLLREVHLACSEYGGGCDAYLLAPSDIHVPGSTAVEKTTLIKVRPPE